MRIYSVRKKNDCNPFNCDTYVVRNLISPLSKALIMLAKIRGKLIFNEQHGIGIRFGYHHKSPNVRFLVWGEKHKEMLTNFMGVPEHRINVTGARHLDSAPNYTSKTGTTLIIDNIVIGSKQHRELLLNKLKKEFPDAVCRPHPSHTKEKLIPFVEELKYYDTVVSFCHSTCLYEAVFCGRKGIVLNNNGIEELNYSDKFVKDWFYKRDGNANKRFEEVMQNVSH